MSSFSMRSDGPINRETVTTTKLTFRDHANGPLRVDAMEEGKVARIQVYCFSVTQNSKADRDTLQRVIADLTKILEAL